MDLLDHTFKNVGFTKKCVSDVACNGFESRSMCFCSKKFVLELVYAEVDLNGV